MSQTTTQNLSPEFAKAIVDATKAVRTAKKDADNSAFRSSYATLEAVIEACKLAFLEQGIAIVQSVGKTEVVSEELQKIILTHNLSVTDKKMSVPVPGLISVSTTLLYKTGESLTSTMEVGLKDAYDPQKAGSAITYARRYALAAMTGVVQSDDDGNLAAGITATGDVEALETALSSGSMEQVKTAYDRLRKNPMGPKHPSFQRLKDAVVAFVEANKSK